VTRPFSVNVLGPGTGGPGAGGAGGGEPFDTAVGDVTEEKLVPVHPDTNATISRNGGSQRAAGRHIIIFAQLHPQLPRQTEVAKAAPGSTAERLIAVMKRLVMQPGSADGTDGRAGIPLDPRSYGVLMQRACTSTSNVIVGQSPCRRLL
jgi:hypothetical protein